MWRCECSFFTHLCQSCKQGLYQHSTSGISLVGRLVWRQVWASEGFPPDTLGADDEGWIHIPCSEPQFWTHNWLVTSLEKEQNKKDNLQPWRDKWRMPNSNIFWPKGEKRRIIESKLGRIHLHPECRSDNEEVIYGKEAVNYMMLMGSAKGIV